MAIARRELGWDVQTNTVLIAGKSSEVVITVRTKDGNDTRVPAGVQGPDVISFSGAILHEEHAEYIVVISPDTGGTTTVTINYEGSPATVIPFVVMDPIISEITPRQVEIGIQRVRINGSNLDGCKIENSTGFGRIIRQLNHHDHILVDIESNQAGNCQLRAVFGQRNRQARNQTVDGVNLQIEFGRPPSLIPWGMVAFMATVFALVAGFSIIFF